MKVIVKPRSAKEWADLLVDNVSTATQLNVERDELPNVEDWRRNAEALFRLALEEDQPPERDWTVDPDTNRYNDSKEFHRLTDVIAQYIRDGAHTLISNGPRALAGGLLAHLAHEHHMAPRRKE